MNEHLVCSHYSIFTGLLLSRIGDAIGVVPMYGLYKNYMRLTMGHLLVVLGIKIPFCLLMKY